MDSVKFFCFIFNQLAVLSLYLIEECPLKAPCSQRWSFAEVGGSRFCDAGIKDTMLDSIHSVKPGLRVPILNVSAICLKGEWPEYSVRDSCLSLAACYFTPFVSHELFLLCL